MSNVLLGTCIGDALGVPFESKPAHYQLLLDWDCKSYLGSEHHDLKPGQYSDDGAFSIAVAQSLIDNHGFNPDDMAKRYVELFTSGTIKGAGRTTQMAIGNLKSGKHWSESGIEGSYGNGTAMRASPFGLYFRNDLYSLINIVKMDSAITHVSDEAEAGALAIAIAAYYAANDDTSDLITKIVPNLPDSKVKRTIYSLGCLVNSKEITPQQSLSILGTRADVRETAPSAIYLFMKFDNYKDAVIAAIKGGKDTDTLAAIVGALFAIKCGQKQIPKEWIDGVENRDKLIELDSQLYNRNSYTFFPG